MNRSLRRCRRRLSPNRYVILKRPKAHLVSESLRYEFSEAAFEFGHVRSYGSCTQSSEMT